MKFYIKSLTLSLIIVFYLLVLINTRDKQKGKKSNQEKKDKFDFKYFYAEAKSHIATKDVLSTNFKALETISKKAFNLANEVRKKMNVHNPLIYSIHYHPKKGKATTFIMSGLSHMSEMTEPYSTFWKICIPYDFSKKPFVDIHCGVGKCSQTLEETRSRKCKTMKELKRSKMVTSDVKMKFEDVLGNPKF